MDAFIWILLVLFVILVMAQISNKKTNTSSKSNDSTSYVNVEKPVDRVIRDVITTYEPGDIATEWIEEADKRGLNYISQGVFSLKGLYYRDQSAQSAAKMLDSGDELILGHEPDNPVDKNAIRVNVLSGEHIGYLPKESGRYFAKRMANVIESKVYRCDSNRDVADVDIFIRFFSDNPDRVDFSSKFSSYQIHDYIKEATELKIEGRLEEAAAKFVCASKDASLTKNMATNVKQACICYRKLKMYKEEKKLIENILKKKHKELTDKQYTDFFTRLDAVNQLIEKNSK